jgi:hypothetical protein
MPIILRCGILHERDFSPRPDRVTRLCFFVHRFYTSPENWNPDALVLGESTEMAALKIRTAPRD